jgi:2-methylcitrate dehydratase PrpD
MTTAHAATDALVEYALATGPDTLPPEVVRAGREIRPDTLAAMIGALTPGLTIAEPLPGYAALEGGEPLASVVGEAGKTGPALAALVNGTFAYALDTERVHGPSITHAAAAGVPA